MLKKKLKIKKNKKKIITINIYSLKFGLYNRYFYIKT